jgi:hypothetical protein
MLKAAIRWFCLGALLLAGCASMGPPTIARDRFDYVASISDSWKRQMLLNLLKVRYADAPVFMDVSSVINSYSLEGDISLGGQYTTGGRGDTFGALGAVGRYADKPTISYQPFAGDKFARSLMSPIPVTGFLLLVQSGYPVEIVLRLCVNTINGLENSYGGPGNPREGSPKFRELMTALREAQSGGGSGMRFKGAKDAQTAVMYLPPTTDEANSPPSRRIRELLGLNASVREFHVVYGTYPETDAEIAILTRSILQVLIDIASYIDVPATDLAEGRVFGAQRTPEQERIFPPLLNVHNGSSPPDDAYVAVRYRNGWFWIEDRDLKSKSMFQSLLLMFSLTETAPTQAPPLVTIPAR